MIEYFELGRVIEDLSEEGLYPETVELLTVCRANPFIDVHEIRYELSETGRTEYIIIDAADGTVDYGNLGQIRRSERLAIGVNHQDRIPVLVYALRKDFPALSHQHASLPDRPRILCLYDSDWTEVQRGWTPQRFLAQIFRWLRESAQLKLHRADQPLEQLFYMSPYRLILPANYPEYAQPGGRALTLMEVSSGSSEPTLLRAVPADCSHQAAPMKLISVMVPAAEATTVESPGVLGDLHDQLTKWGSNLHYALHKEIFEAVRGGVKPTIGKDGAILILLWIPRTRQGVLERTDAVGYVVEASLFELAKELEILDVPDEHGVYYPFSLIGGSQSMGWRDFPLMPVEVRSAMTVGSARDISGITEDASDFNGILAGVGALGSALADMWVRQGWGRWTFVDADRVMPHNLSRHIALDTQIGHPKASVMREFAQLIFPNEPAPAAIVSSISDRSECVETAMANAQLVVDVTTTIEAPRELARLPNGPRTVSLFVTPSGLSSVMLLEDRQRTTRLDALEGQYYRALLRSEWGATHLENHLGDRWVGGSCRDISVRMSIECIYSHAGNLSRQLRQSVLRDQARICVWAYDDASGAISVHEVPVSPVHTTRSNEWTIIYDSAFLQTLKQMRSAALPNETGGSLVGVTDFQAKTIVIVDAIPAPLDSDASPSHFKRGEEGQFEALENVRERTAGIVGYLGEWHSHPHGYTAQPSEDDRRLLDTLHRKMRVEGLPAVMLIVANDDVTCTVR